LIGIDAQRIYPERHGFINWHFSQTLSKVGSQLDNPAIDFDAESISI
jgi:hypothetical protein